MESLREDSSTRLIYIATDLAPHFDDDSRPGLRLRSSVPGRPRTYLSFQDFVEAVPPKSVVFFDVAAKPAVWREVVRMLADAPFTTIASTSGDIRWAGETTALTSLWESLLLGGRDAVPAFAVESLVRAIEVRSNQGGSEWQLAVHGKGSSTRSEPLWQDGKWAPEWFNDEARLASTSRGSREDAVQELVQGLSSPDKAVRARSGTLALWLSGADRHVDVRAAAARALAHGAVEDLMLRIGEPELKLSELGFLPIPAGKYMIGSQANDPDACPEELPQHAVELGGFQAMVTPLLSRHVEALGVVDAVARNWALSEPEVPVGKITWFEAVALAKALTDHFRRSGEISSTDRISLPSEAEWEVAAAGPTGLRYPWGDVFERGRCNSFAAGLDRPVAARSYSPVGDSGFGLADMAGNVWEWTTTNWGTSSHYPDWSYPYDPDDGREATEAAGDVRRVVRGGAYYYFDDCVRCSTRNYMYPHTRHSGGGVRFVLHRSV